MMQYKRPRAFPLQVMTMLILVALACASPTTVAPPRVETTDEATIPSQPDCQARGRVELETVAWNGASLSRAATFTAIGGDSLTLSQNGKATLNFGSGNIFTLYAPKDGSGPADIKAWNGTRVIAVSAGSGHVVETNAPCQLTALEMGEVRLTAVGTEYTYAFNPQSNRALVAVYDGSVDVRDSNGNPLITLSRSQGAILAGATVESMFMPPDLGTTLDRLGQGLDILGNDLPGIGAAPPIGTEPPMITEPPPFVISLRVWSLWGVDDPSLEKIRDAFEARYPDIQVEIESNDFTALVDKYRASLAAGDAPDILIYNHENGARFIKQGLVSPLNELASQGLFDSLDRRATAAVTYDGLLTALPIAMKGVVLYRNPNILPDPPTSFDFILEAVSVVPSRFGSDVTAVYWDVGPFFTAAHLYGLGGSMMDENGLPTFYNSTGSAWLDLVSSMRDTGAMSVSDDNDLEAFTNKQTGLIVDGTWNMYRIAGALGSESVAIDPWPLYGNGRMAGFLQFEVAYLNPQITGDQQKAAWTFMEFMASPQAQEILHDLGHIPVSVEIGITDPLIQQAMVAFGDNAALPNHPNVEYYWAPLSDAINTVAFGDTEFRPSNEDILLQLEEQISGAIQE